MADASLPRIEQWMDGYYATFPPGSPTVADALAMKIDHCRHVREEARAIAAGLGLDSRQAECAAIAGLLHDVARFEQYSRFGTFVDARSYNHGVRGSEIIAEARVLSALPDADALAVTEAVRHHNGLAIPAGLSETGNLLTRIVRDADKLDIYRVAVGVYTGTARNSAVELELPDSPGVSPAVVARILGGSMARICDLTRLSDFKLLQMAWITDVNFTPTLALIHDRGYLASIRSTLPHLPEVDDVYRTMTGILDSRRANADRAGHP